MWSKQIDLENIKVEYAVVPGGIIILDNYYFWEGYTKAVHDYFSKDQRPEKIYQFNLGSIYH